MTASTTIRIQANLQGRQAFAQVGKGAQQASQQLGRMGNVANRFGPLGKRLGGVLGGVGKALTGPLGVALGAGAATTAFVTFAKSAIAAADELGKAATRTGVSVEALSSLEVAARQGGTSIADLETGLAAMAKRALDSTRGLASAGRGFDALGVSVTDSSGALKDTETLYGELADAFSMLEDGATKNALAQDVFGRSGKNLIPVLNQTSKALSDNVTTSTTFARQSEMINDRLDDLAVIGRQVGNTLLTGLLPPLVSLLEATVDGARALGERLRPAWEALQRAFEQVRPVIETVIRTFWNMGTILRRTVFPILQGLAGDVLQTLWRSFQQVWQVIRRFLPTGRSLANWGRLAENVMKGVGITVLRTAGLFRQFASVMRNIGSLRFDSIVSDWQAIGRETAAAVQGVREVGTEVGVVETAVEEVESATMDVGEAWVGPSGVTGGVKQATAAVEVMKDKVVEVGAIQKRLDADRLRREQGIQQVTIVTLDEQIAKGMEAHVQRVQQVSYEGEITLEALRNREAAEAQALEKRKQAELDALAELEAERARGMQAFRDDIQGAIAGLIRGTTSWGGALQGILNGVLNRIVEKISGNIADSILTGFTNVGNHAGGVFSKLAQGLPGLFQPLFKFLGEGFSNVVKFTGGLFRNLINGIGSGLNSVLRGFSGGLNGLIKGVGSALSGLLGGGGGLAVGNLGIGSGIAAIGGPLGTSTGALSSGLAGLLPAIPVVGGLAFIASQAFRGRSPAGDRRVATLNDLAGRNIGGPGQFSADQINAILHASRSVSATQAIALSRQRSKIDGNYSRRRQYEEALANRQDSLRSSIDRYLRAYGITGNTLEAARELLRQRGLYGGGEAGRPTVTINVQNGDPQAIAQTVREVLYEERLAGGINAG